MTPLFAIDFAEDGLTLLHRSPMGWQVVGRTTYDQPDLRQAIDALRAEAARLARPGFVTTTLVLPNSQIRYFDLSLPPGDRDETIEAIRAELDGRTPYALDDLVFDYVLRGGKTQVAVVARETLAEAEGFAVTCGMNPLSFTAVAPPGRFDGVPFFGPAASAKTLLGTVQTIPRETRPVQAAPPEDDRFSAPPRVTDWAEFTPRPAPVRPVAPPVPRSAPGPRPADPVAAPDPSPSVAPGPTSTGQADAAAPGPAPAKPGPEPAAPEPIAAAEIAAFDPLAIPAAAPVLDPVQDQAVEAPLGEAADAPMAVDVPLADAPPAPAPKPEAALTTWQAAPESRARAAAKTDQTRSGGFRFRLPGGLGKGSNAGTAPARRIALAPTASAAKPGPYTRAEGARSPARRRAGSRYLGLILTGLLLICLAVAAALSSFYMAAFFDPASPPAQVSPAQVDLAQAPVAADQGGTALAPDQPQEAVPALVQVPTDPVPEAGTEAASEAAPVLAQAKALDPQSANADPPPARQTAPPVAEATPDLASNGPDETTPEGTDRPEGVVIATDPPAPAPAASTAVVTAPPARPADLAADPVEAPTPETAVTALTPPRPKIRPEGLVAPASTIVLAPEQTAVPGLRPRPRPTVVLAAVPTKPEDRLAEASLVTNDPNRSVLALTVSLRPPPRPADLSRAVAAAVAAAARQPDPAPDQVAALDPALAEADAGGDEQGTMPETPTRASVAKQATVANALNLSRLSLIGVYGSSSNRYAMVRQPNGRYLRVGVGDRLDGGRVAAIGDSELRYQKGGRMLVLDMPRG